jgi:hypothetical protein
MSIMATIVSDAHMEGHGTGRAQARLCPYLCNIAGQRCQCADPRRQLGQLFRRTYNNGPKSLAEKDRLDPYLIRWRK